MMQVINGKMYEIVSLGEVESDELYKFEQPGDSIIGNCGEHEEHEGFWTHEFFMLGKEEPIKFNANGLLHGKIKKALTKSSFVRITYNGEIQSSKTKWKYKDYKVEPVEVKEVKGSEIKEELVS